MSRRHRPLNERTGDPSIDNGNRAANRVIRKFVANLRVITPHGRRRKAIVTRIERGTMAEIVAVAFQSGSRSTRAASKQESTAAMRDTADA